MEELGKTIELKPEVAKKEKTEKMSYEQLTNICQQLHEQNKQLVNEVQQMRMELSALRLSFLFEVVKNSSEFDSELVEKATNEITFALYPPTKIKSGDEGAYMATGTDKPSN